MRPSIPRMYRKILVVSRERIESYMMHGPDPSSLSASNNLVKSTKLDAAGFLREVASVYSSMSTYSDSGVVYDCWGQERKYELHFETRFLGPKLFRFTSSKPHPFPPLSHLITTCSCGFDGESYYLALAIPNMQPTREVYDSISLPIAGATALSSGAAHTIGRLLFTRVGGFGLSDILDPEIVREEVFEDNDCMVIQGKHPHGSDVRVWIDIDNRSIRKLCTSVSGFLTEEIRRDIRVNEPMKADEVRQSV